MGAPIVQMYMQVRSISFSKLPVGVNVSVNSSNLPQALLILCRYER